MKLILLVAFAAFVSLSYSARIPDYKVICYYGSWAVYRPGNGKFDVEDYTTDLCTHGIFTFTGLNQDGSVHILDSWNEVDKNALGRFVELKKRNPNFKAIIAMGGWNEGSQTYSTVANNPSLRANMVKSVSEFVAKWGFDGFDLDWEYPAYRGGAPSDRVGLISLLKELRAEFDKHGWLLTAAVSANKEYHDTAYDVPEMNKYLDYINVMAYDLHGVWDQATGFNAPLYPKSNDVNKFLNVEAAIKAWIASGASPSKLILGMGVYGRSFTLANSGNNGVGVAIQGGGQAGPYTRESGFIGFLEICEWQKEGGWTTVWDDEAQVPYTYKGNQWIGYDNVESIALKAQFAKDYNLAGAMIWSIETEDPKNICGFGPFPILQSINNVFHSNLPPTKPTTTKPTTKPTGTTQSTTPTTTTTKIPPSSICKKEGYVRDPVDCGKFYYCMVVGDTWTTYPYACPEGLGFDEERNICDLKENVGC